MKSIYLNLLLTCSVVGCSSQESLDVADRSEKETSRVDQPIGEYRSNDPLPVRLAAKRNPEGEQFWRLLDAYQSISTYSDRGEAVLRYRQNGKMLEDRAPLSVHWEAPNRLEIAAYDARLIADGQRLWQWVLSPSTDNLDRQLAMRDSPATLDLKTIIADETWASSAAAGLAGPPPQLTWLFLPPPEEQRPEVTRLPDTTEAGRTFLRFAIGDEKDRRVFWVDATSRAIHRVELPPPPTPGATEVQLSVELNEASFSRNANRLIEQLPPDSRRVKGLVPPPPTLPSPLLGRNLPPFRLSSHDNRLVITQQGTGKVALLVWIADHPASQAVLRDLQRFADSKSGKLDVLTVMSEPITKRNTGDLLRSWMIGLPWSNDEAAIGRDVFQIREAPTFVILDMDGSVQFVIARWSEQLIPMIAGIVEELAAGRKPGKTIREEYEKAVDQYRRQLEAVTISSAG